MNKIILLLALSCAACHACHPKPAAQPQPPKPVTTVYHLGVTPVVYKFDDKMTDQQVVNVVQRQGDAFAQVMQGARKRGLECRVTSDDEQATVNVSCIRALTPAKAH